MVGIENGLFFPVSSFWKEQVRAGQDTLFLFLKGVDECVNRVTELFTYDIYLLWGLISSHTDVVRIRALFLAHSLPLSDVADDFLTDLDNKCLC